MPRYWSGGYIINDIYDLKADRINKPDKVWIPNIMKFENAKILYYSISLLGLALGVLLSISLKQYFGFIWFLLPIVLLYYYAERAKKILFISNLIVSLLIAFSLIIMLFFERNILETANTVLNLNNTIWVLTLFAFLINFVREIVKDVADIEGDRIIGVISIPIKYGIRTTKLIIIVLILAVCGIVLFFSIKFYESQALLIGYLVLAVLTSLVMFIIHLRKAKTTNDFTNLSTYLKIIMIIGMLSVFMIKPV